MNYQINVKQDPNLVYAWFTGAEIVGSSISELCYEGIYTVSGAPANIAGLYIAGAIVKNAADGLDYRNAGTTNSPSFVVIGGGAGNPAGSSSWVQYNNAGSFGADVNFTRDPSTFFTTIQTPLSMTETAGFYTSNNILGFGISGALMKYADTAHPGTYGLAMLADATPIDGGDPGIIAIWGVVSPGGGPNANFQGLYDDTVDGADVQISARNSTGNEARINLSANPAGYGIQFQYGSGANYEFPGFNPAPGQVLGYTAPHTLGWVSGGGGSPGGSNTDVQFNNSGAFGGSSNFTWDDGNQNLFVGNGGGAWMQIQNSGLSNYVTFQGQSFSVEQAATGNVALDMNMSVGFPVIQMGAVGGWGNHTVIKMDDNASQIYLQANNSTLIQDSGSTTIASFSPGSGNPIVSLGAFSGQGNKTLFTINDNAYRATLIADEGFYINNTAGDGWLAIDPSAVGNNIALGDLNSVGNKNIFTISDSNQLINFQASNEFAITDANVAPATWFLVNTGTGTDRVALGDISNAYNLTKLIVDDGAQTILSQTNGTIKFTNSGGDVSFTVSPSTWAVTLGNVTGSGNGTKIDLNDSGQQVSVTIQNGFGVYDHATDHEYFGVNPSTGICHIGAVSGVGNGTAIIVDDSTQTISFASSNNGLHETTVSSDIPHRVAVTVTSSEFKNLTSASVPLVSAPPSGYFIHIVDLSVETIFGTTAYTLGATHPGIGYGGSGQYIFKNATLDAAWTATSTQFAPISGNSLASTTTSYDGQSLDLFSGDDPTLGDGTFIIYITYQILKD